MRFGLDEHIIEKIIQVFEINSKVDKALVFGSRAKGNYRPDSDIDVAIKGNDITIDDILKMSVALEDKGITNKIDLINYTDIKEKALVEHIDRVGIEFYSRWEEYKLGNIADITSSKRIYYSDYVTEGIPFFRSKEIIEKSLGESSGEPLFISKKRYNDIKEKFGAPIDGDLLISAVGERAGIPYVIKNQGDFYFKDGNLIWLRNIKSDLNVLYFNYWIKSSIGQSTLDSIMIGSAQKALTIIGLKNLLITLPPPVEQKAIASMLSSLDSKIELLHYQNKTLEQLTETLFRQWFLKVTEESAENKTLGDFIETTLGGEWGKEIHEEDYELQVQCIRGTDIADLETGIPERTPIRFIKQNKFDSIEIQNGDLVIEISGGTDDQSTGRTAYINDDVKALFKYPLIFSNFCRLIRPKRKEYSFFLYSYIHHLYKQGDLFNLENGSSGIKNLNYKALLFSLEYRLPNKEKVIQYNNDVEKYFYKINKNKTQILTLKQLRDTLLPKLMSGEVRVTIN
jgi:type I restriction enzyme S subunit